MDETSSKFVDQLATERIINEKLGTVHHRSNKPYDVLTGPVFDTFATQLGPPKMASPKRDGVFHLMTPLVWSHHMENHIIPVRYYPANEPRGAILLVHGLFEDTRELYQFFISGLNRRNFDVYMTTLPFHHERTPVESRFSGEYFLSADLDRTKQAFTQAVLEVRYCVDWLFESSDLPVFVVGFSMGGTVALGAAAASDNTDKLVVVNPAANLSDVIWTSPLCATIKADLIASGYGESETAQVIASFDPFEMPHCQYRQDQELIIYGLFDQITRPDQYESLINRWGFEKILQYKAGHLNTLRVPRFATDVTRFLISESDEMSSVAFPGGAA